MWLQDLSALCSKISFDCNVLFFNLRAIVVCCCCFLALQPICYHGRRAAMCKHISLNILSKAWMSRFPRPAYDSNDKLCSVGYVYNSFSIVLCLPYSPTTISNKFIYSNYIGHFPSYSDLLNSLNRSLHLSWHFCFFYCFALC